MEYKKHSLDFGKMEHVLNYSCQLYQLSRPNKVGEVMALIRQCQPESIEEWEDWYFDNAYTATKDPAKSTKVTRQSIEELGERLYDKIINCVIPSWLEAFNEISLEDCVDYVYNVTINRTYDGYIREKSVVFDSLAEEFPDYEFEESDPELDHAGDVDFVINVGDYKIGLQIKPVTAKSNFGGYSLSARMKSSFDDFTAMFGGKVFVVYSLKGEVANEDVIPAIAREIKRLERLV